jgi:hypothetical protein
LEMQVVMQEQIQKKSEKKSCKSSIILYRCGTGLARSTELIRLLIRPTQSADLPRITRRRQPQRGRWKCVIRVRECGILCGRESHIGGHNTGGCVTTRPGKYRTIA